MTRITTTAVLILAMAAWAAPHAHGGEEDASHHDIVIYGDTSAAITAAVQAVRMGRDVVIVSPARRLGGMTTSGLGWTDAGDRDAIGGLAHEFYHRLWKHYQDEDAWPWEDPDAFDIHRGQHGSALDDETETAWVFEPSAAEKVYEAFIAEYGIPVHRDEWLDRDNGVEMDGNRVVSITTLSGRTYHGEMFIDTTYEGDLMAAAGVSYTIGRESNEQYGETLNGIQTGRAVSNQLPWGVDPYVEEGNPDSGLLPYVNPDPGGADGEGDERLQAYCFRLVLTDVPENRVEVPQPEGYGEEDFELLFRAIEAGQRDRFYKWTLNPNRKTDSNNDSGMSQNLIGGNYDLDEGWNYAEASYDKREEIIAKQRYWQQGLVWTLRNHPRVPEEIREQHKPWGLPADEFEDNDHWPPQIYVREARRMVGDFVVTENHVRQNEPTPRSVGMGSYNMDSHNVQRHVVYDEDGRAHVRNEGDVQVPPGGPYPIDYGAILPRKEEAANLLVPVAVSASHIAFGSIRMEPVFMILGQSAATAASLAMDGEWAVQDVPYEALRQRLENDDQALYLDMEPAVDPADLEGIVLDHPDADLEGGWSYSAAQSGFVGRDYLHDSNTDKGAKTARYEAALPARGAYEVRISYAAHANRASNVPVSVVHAGGSESIEVDQRQEPPIEGMFLSLGEFEFDGDGAVVISNEGTDGYVVADAVQWLPVD